MNKAFTVIAALLLGAPLYAQETLFDGKVDIGGFGGPAVHFTSINKQFGALVGGGGGVIIDHKIAIGGAGFGLVNNVTEETAPATRPYLNLGYGGAFIRYIHQSDDLIHFTAGVLVGGGGVGFRRDFDGNNPDDIWDNDTDSLNDAFFLVEPDLEAELNVSKNFRIGAGASYRFVSGVELPGVENSDIGGPSARLMLKFGGF